MDVGNCIPAASPGGIVAIIGQSPINVLFSLLSAPLALGVTLAQMAIMFGLPGLCAAFMILFGRIVICYTRLHF